MYNIKLMLIAFISILISQNFSLSQSAPSISSLEIFCGSRAPYGTNYSVTIDNSGNLKYEESTIDEPSKHKSHKMVLTPSQLNEIFNKAKEFSFFNLALPKVYDLGTVDGSGISISITDTEGNNNHIQPYNYPINRVDEVVKKINGFLPNGYKLDYWALHQ